MRHAQSYIVRVYIRDRSGILAGTVEVVRTGERCGFSSAEELLRIVVHGCPGGRGKRPAKPAA
jgi:hypothetical protein